MDVLVFLQNAWSPVYAGRMWPRDSWLRALARSRSGQRLRLLIDDFSVCENTTPQVAATSNGQLPPEPAHIRAVLTRRTTLDRTLIITCGAQATRALVPLWSGALVAVPHPAHRLLTNQLYLDARALVSTCTPATRLQVIQDKGLTRVTTL